MSARTALFVWLGLLALLAATVGCYWLDLGRANVAVNLAIAAGKAGLVAWFYMHLREQQRLVWVWAGAGWYWLGIMLVLTFSDYLTRGWEGIPGK